MFCIWSLEAVYACQVQFVCMCAIVIRIWRPYCGHMSDRTQTYLCCAVIIPSMSSHTAYKHTEFYLGPMCSRDTCRHYTTPPSSQTEKILKLEYHHHSEIRTWQTAHTLCWHYDINILTDSIRWQTLSLPRTRDRWRTLSADITRATALSTIWNS